MRKGVVAGAALTLAGGIGAYGGYEVAESLNSEPIIYLEEARQSLAQDVLGYVAVAESGSCEQNVLSTMYNINAVNTPKDPELTTAALDTVCGQSEGNYHVDLAQRSSEIFARIQSGKSRVARLEDTTVFDLDDKESGVAAGLAVSFVSFIGVAAILNTDRVSNLIRRQPKDSPSSFTKPNMPRKSSEPEGRVLAREARLAKPSDRWRF